MKNQITVITTTHIHEYAPSVEILKRNLYTAYKNFSYINTCKHFIYVDSKVKDETYKKYVNNILELVKQKYPNIEVIDSPNSGLRFNYWHAINSIDTPLMLFLEHDWEFLLPVDLEKIAEVFSKYDFVNLIKLPKRSNMINMKVEDRLWDFEVKSEDRVKELDITKTSSFATNPHIIRKSKFLQEWKYHLNYPGSNHNSIELPLRDKYRDEINVFGFDEVHSRWGCYNYGRPDGPKYITHLDASKSGKL